MTVYFSIIDNDETADESPQAKSGHHPHFDRAVMRSRRKSVSFAVYKVNADTMQFDIEHKSVLLGNLSGRVRLAFDSGGLDMYRGVPALPRLWDLKKTPLREICVSGTVLKTQLT